MLEICQSILASVVGVIFAKWVDSIWPSKEPSITSFNNTLHVISQVNVSISNKKTLSEQINDRIFLSNGMYYFLTFIMLYCLLALAYMILFASETYFNYPLQQNFISDFARDYGENRSNLLSIIISFLLYPLINFISRGVFKVIIYFLKSLNFTFTDMNVQQIRMGTCVFLATLLALGVVIFSFKY